MKTTRKGTNDRIKRLIARHRELMQPYLAQGIDSDTASARAFEDLKKENVK
jgi:hypothetical protein